MTVNRYPAACTVCGVTVPERAGTMYRNGRRWAVTHIACGDGTPSVIAITLASGHTMTRNRRGTCIDAPCCGCCSF
jgi:hypothetical protein